MLWMVLCSYISAVYVLLCMKLCLFACHCHTPLNLLVCHATLAWQYVMGGLSAVYVLLLYIVCMKLCLFAWHCHAPLNLLGSLPGPEISGSNFLFILQNQKTKGDISVLTERRTPVETMTLHTGPEWHVYHTDSHFQTDITRHFWRSNYVTCHVLLSNTVACYSLR